VPCKYYGSAQQKQGTSHDLNLAFDEGAVSGKT
jgi:hypothetical protein